jgi:arsenate reductase
METTKNILFICPHGAAKSVIAAADCRQQAALGGLSIDALSAGTEPDDVVPLPVVAALRAEGIDVSGYRPRQVTSEDFAAAGYIVSLGCDLDGLIPPGTVIERWNDIPPVSEDIDRARAAIRSHVIALLDRMECP